MKTAKITSIRVESERLRNFNVIKHKLERDMGRKLTSSEFLLFVEAVPYEEVRKYYIKAFNEMLERKGLLV